MEKVTFPKSQPLWFELTPVISSYTDAKSIGAKILSVDDELSIGITDKSLNKVQIGDILHGINGTLVKTASFAAISNMLKELLQQKEVTHAGDSNSQDLISLEFFRAGDENQTGTYSRLSHKVGIYLFLLYFIVPDP